MWHEVGARGNHGESGCSGSGLAALAVQLDQLRPHVVVGDLLAIAHPVDGWLRRADELCDLLFGELRGHQFGDELWEHAGTLIHMRISRQRTGGFYADGALWRMRG